MARVSNLFLEHVKDEVLLPEAPIPELITEEFRKEIAETLSMLKGQRSAFNGNAITKKKTHVTRNDGYKVPVSIFTPEGSGPFPIVVFYHGGGWCINLDDHYDVLIDKLVAASGCMMVSVDYRLAPEEKFPVGVEDCYAALEWVHKNASSFNGDANRIVVMGDSSGGNLATVAAMVARDRNGPKLSKQILIFPVTDASDFDTQTYKRYGKDYILERQDMIHYVMNYVEKGSDVKAPYISPLKGDLAGMPPTLIISAECDVLADQGMKYARKLYNAGVEVEYSIYRGMPHGFIGADYEEARDAIAEIGEALRLL